MRRVDAPWRRVFLQQRWQGRRFESRRRDLPGCFADSLPRQKRSSSGNPGRPEHGVEGRLSCRCRTPRLGFRIGPRPLTRSRSLWLGVGLGPSDSESISVSVSGSVSASVSVSYLQPPPAWVCDTATATDATATATPQRTACSAASRVPLATLGAARPEIQEEPKKSGTKKVELPPSETVSPLSIPVTHY